MPAPAPGELETTAGRGAAAGQIRIDGPALIFGGNYSNLEATRALLAAARRLGIEACNVVCTGDVIAYCADPLATIEVMRRSGVHVLMGNCEAALSSDGTGCGSASVGGKLGNLAAAEWFAFARRMLDADARAWMRSLPRRLQLSIGGRRLAVIHGGAAATEPCIFASTAASIKRDELERAAAGDGSSEGVLSGDGGLPFSEIVDGRLWHNPGVIGMPANDGTPRTWYSTLVPAGGKLRIEMHALDYDYATAAKKMRQAGLSERYALALQTGLWPNCDALPEAERASRGRALASGSLEW